MELNPYANDLGDRDPIEVISHTCGRIRELIDRTPEDELQLCPPSKKWNAREIVCHMADCEIVFCFRLKQTLAEDGPTLQPFDQEKWAKRYANLDVVSALRLFEAARNWNILLIDAITSGESVRPVTHPERGTMTFWTIVETMAGHDTNHLRQLEQMATG